MAKILDPILPILSMLEYCAIILGSFGGPGLSAEAWRFVETCPRSLTFTLRSSALKAV